MNKIGLMAALLILLSVIMVSCKSDPPTDVVHDITPVHLASSEQRAILDDLKDVRPEDRAAFIKKAWPNLSKDLVAGLSRRNIIKPGDEVTYISYIYGSAESVRGESRDEKEYEGVFHDELIATIRTKDIDEPITLAVYCSNGLFELRGKFALLYNEKPETEFTIAQGVGLCSYVSFDTAIDLAERFSLPLFRGIPKHRIMVAEARALKDETDRVLVTVQVYPGDHFDLVNRIYEPAPRTKRDGNN